MLLCAVSCLGAAQSCVPLPKANPWVQVEEMPVGCWTSFLTSGNEEVHILNIQPGPSVRMDACGGEESNPHPLPLTVV